MRLIDAESLKELFPDNGEGSWTYNATAKAYIDAQPTIQPNTTTHDSIPAETGKNDGDRTSGDCISRQMAIDALCDYLVGKRCPDDGTLTCRLIENEVINKLPSVQPEQRWIPVSERLPDKRGFYLVTEKEYRVGDKKHSGKFETKVSFVEFREKWNRASFFEITAWMPLPEPYQEDGEQDE